jgi:Ca-activated chloride channel family protein
MDLALPKYLLLLVVVAVIAARLVWLYLWQRRARREFLGPQARHWPGGTLGLRAGLLAVGLVLAVLAAARPQWGSRPVINELRGVDVVIVLDISPSMDARDVNGESRRARANAAAALLAENLLGNRVALVEFAKTAILRAPLTTDTRAVGELIKASPRDIRLVQPGTDFPVAFQQAARALADSPDSGRAVVLISDGEDHSGNALRAADELASLGISIYTVGVGTAAGATIPVDGIGGRSNLRLNSDGVPIITYLEEAHLENLATIGDGRYVSVNENSRAILELQREILGLRHAAIGDRVGEVKTERLELFLLPAIVLLAGEWLLQALSPNLRLRVAFRREKV